MPKLPRLSGNEVVKALIRLGFIKARQKGSHVVMKKVLENKTVGCVVPMHSEIAKGTLRNILRQSDIDPDNFLKNI